jgi:hypothetical protein
MKISILIKKEVEQSASQSFDMQLALALALTIPSEIVKFQMTNNKHDLGLDFPNPFSDFGKSIMKFLSAAYRVSYEIHHPWAYFPSPLEVIAKFYEKNSREYSMFLHFSAYPGRLVLVSITSEKYSDFIKK